jgi:hypothetical protein
LGFLWVFCVSVRSLKTDDTSPQFVFNFKPFAMSVMELAQAIVEEEFEHKGRLSAAARARLVLSRFLVVVIVSLAIESLVAIFKLSQQGQTRAD